MSRPSPDGRHYRAGRRSSTLRDMSEPVIDVRGLRRSYGAVEAVRDVSFTVARGEVLCLLGPNGAGKTTTTEILEGYRTATAGEVRVLGHDPARGERALRERIGIVLQETGVQAHLTVLELLTMYGGMYPRRRDPDELLVLVGLEGKEDAQARELSGGQRRRLDLGLALVGEPELLFLDEPTKGFDPEARRRAWRIVRELADAGTTVFLTTHFMDEAQTLADRIGVMRAGELVALAPADELRDRIDAPARVAFRLPAGVALDAVPRVGDATLSAGAHGEVVLTAADGVAAAHAVTGWALAEGVALRDFTVTRPSLEDVYLELTAPEVPA
jgi:ABC-2 type transport system ATP-binding protein